jgi:hypothetical protein
MSQFRVVLQDKQDKNILFAVKAFEFSALLQQHLNSVVLKITPVLCANSWRCHQVLSKNPTLDGLDGVVPSG